MVIIEFSLQLLVSMALSMFIPSLAVCYIPLRQLCLKEEITCESAASLNSLVCWKRFSLVCSCCLVLVLSLPLLLSCRLFPGELVTHC